MPLPVTAKLPKPKSEDEFEDMVLDVLNREWGADLKRYGRRGQRQNGVDHFGKRWRDPNALIGVQCKKVESLTEGEIREEVTKAESFPFPLAEYCFATSLDRDAGLQRVVHRLSEERRANGKFPVEIVFWETLERGILASRVLMARHYPGFALPGEIELEQLLYPPYESLTPSASAGAKSFATLLKPQYQQVPFKGREEERRKLRNWADWQAAVGIRVLLCVGPGGQGKTRLAAECATELQAKGWLVGFVQRGASTEGLKKALQATASDALLLVDYAGRRVEQVVALLQAAESRGSGRTALLLLERSQGDWWAQLRVDLTRTTG